MTPVRPQIGDDNSLVTEQTVHRVGGVAALLGQGSRQVHYYYYYADCKDQAHAFGYNHEFGYNYSATYKK